MAWGAAADETRYHDLPEIVITGDGPKRNWLPVVAIGAAALAVLFLAGKK